MNERINEKVYEMSSWIDLYNMTNEQVENLSEEKQMEWINLNIRQSRREKTRCSRLPLFIYKVRKIYEETTGSSFHELWKLPDCAADGRLITRALNAVRDSEKYKKSADVIDLNRDVDEWSMADLELIDSCLKYSLRYEFLLIHYNEQAMWANKNFAGVDAWDAYGGFFRECRSPVLNLFTMEYALLPYAKFCNIGESEEYSVENVAKRISEAREVEVSDKLDGSMIQISNIHDERFWNGCIVATSGSLYPSRAGQLMDVLRYLDNSKEIAELLDQEPDENTYIFEWIDKNDPHIVRYHAKDYGLHLIGRRSHKSGGLWSVSHVRMQAERHGVQTTELYDLSLGTILENRDLYRASEKEGFVLYADGFLVKIKCSDYIGIARLIRSAQSFNTVLKYVVDGNVDDMTSVLPDEYKIAVQEIVQRIYRFEAKMIELIEKEYKELPIEAGKKAVMLHIDHEIVDPYGMLKNFVRAKYLGKPIEILAQKKGNTIQYISEGKMKKYEEWFKRINSRGSGISGK